MYSITLKIPEKLKWSDDQLFDFCQLNKNLVIERIKTQKILIMSPAGGKTGNQNFNLYIDFGIWNRQFNLGYLFDSSTGFILPDGSMRSPDIAFVTKLRWENLTLEEQEKFPPLCPDFVLELKSPSDTLKKSLDKIQSWMNNGCQLAWLIDTSQKVVYIKKKENSEQIIKIDNNTILSGEDVLVGLNLEIGKIFD